MMKKVAEVGDLLPQRGRVVVIDDHPVAIFNLDGDYVAIQNTCPHRGGSLGAGEAKGEIVTCPWHGWEFNLRTGEAVENPGIKIERYRVVVTKGGVYIEWPERKSV